MNTPAYTWYHCDVPLATEYLLEQLVAFIKKCGFVQPNFEKMQKDLEEKGEFSYACGIYRIEKK